MTDIDKLAADIAGRKFDITDYDYDAAIQAARLGILEGMKLQRERDAEIVPDVLDFLMGIAPLEGCYFGERHPTRKGAFWWRTVLRERSAMIGNYPLGTSNANA